MLDGFAAIFLVPFVFANVYVDTLSYGFGSGSGDVASGSGDVLIAPKNDELSTATWILTSVGVVLFLFFGSMCISRVNALRQK